MLSGGVEGVQRGVRDTAYDMGAEVRANDWL